MQRAWRRRSEIGKEKLSLRSPQGTECTSVGLPEKVSPQVKKSCPRFRACLDRLKFLHSVRELRYITRGRNCGQANSPSCEKWHAAVGFLACFCIGKGACVPEALTVSIVAMDEPKARWASLIARC